MYILRLCKTVKKMEWKKNHTEFKKWSWKRGNPAHCAVFIFNTLYSWMMQI